MAYTEVKITTEHIKRSKKRISGYFKLSDGSKTEFEITPDYSWQQWGNTTEKLWITVPRLEELEQDLLDI